MFAFSSLITWTLFMQMKIDLSSQIDGPGQTQVAYTIVTMTMNFVLFAHKILSL